ncbi:DUF5655 domain-containing protein [Corynebacterium alimapuense]|uniref:Transporter n=1 Tax=Corynebacterium alimapuense TaxID=1576874 RepID=A0A3M8K536_9CORY|nr:DUF5655 domain-containing protein [Corynebacterium alimapuense]RNE48333.1 transporter [Corynebacterium alimapuense]
MILFEVGQDSAKQVKPMTTVNGKKVLERDIQKIFEGSLYEILGVHFLASEYSTSFGGRMDTLGIDDDGNPCIIEYKKGQNENVINQGLSYLRWLLDHKDSFHVLCQEKGVEKEVQWDAPRVICVAESYSRFDTDTADLLPIKIELMRYQLFGNNMLTLDTESYQKVRLQGVPKLGASVEKKPETLQVTYTLDDHLAKGGPASRKLFDDLKERLLGLDQEMELEPKKLYVVFKMTRNVTDVIFQKQKLWVFINVKSGTLEDPRGIAENLVHPVKKGHWGNGDYRVEVTPKTDLDYLMTLVEQSYSINQ